MVAPLIAAGLAYAPEILSGIGSIVVPSIIDALTTHGPTPEGKAKIKEILDAEAMKRAQAQGIPLAAAQKAVEDELGPQLEKAFSEEPGLMQSILTWGLGGVAGGIVGHKLGGAIGGARAKMRLEKPGRDAVEAEMTGMSSKLPTKPKPAEQSPTTGQRLLEREPDLGAEVAGEREPDYDVDDILKGGTGHQTTAPPATRRVGEDAHDVPASGSHPASLAAAEAAPAPAPRMPPPGPVEAEGPDPEHIIRALSMAERIESPTPPPGSAAALTFNLGKRRVKA